MVLHRIRPKKEEIQKTSKVIAKSNRTLKKEHREKETHDAQLSRPGLQIARGLCKSLLGDAAEKQVRGLGEKWVWTQQLGGCVKKTGLNTVVQTCTNHVYKL